MRVFVDTNILLDVALRRGEFFGASMKCLSWCEETSHETFIAWHSISNLFYIANRSSGREVALEYIEDLVSWVDIAPATKREVVKALSEPSKDFEDTLQMRCAESAGCDALITRNPNDFKLTQIPVFSPLDFCAEFID